MAEFVKVAQVDEVPPGSLKQIVVGTATLCLANVDGQFYAIGDTCTHQEGPLSEGTLEGPVVTCPWHAAEFDVRTGAVLALPAAEPVPAYDVRVEGSDVLVATEPRG